MNEIIEALNEVTSAFSESQQRTSARLLSLEQRAASRGGSGGTGLGGDLETRSLGHAFIESPELKSWIGSSRQGTVRVPLETRAITNLGTVVPADRQREIVGLAKRRMTIRDLLPTAVTTSNSIQFVRETALTNGASFVPENTLKSESDITFGLVDVPVRTLATWLRASRQSLDDLPQLAAFVDQELRYAIRYVEEVGLLTGPGTGQTLTGLIPNATAYQTSRNVTGDSRLDIIHHSIAQLADNGFTATGLVLNLADYSRMLESKDSGGNYLSLVGGPFGVVDQDRLWGVSVAATPAMTAGGFLVLDAPMAATLFDRMNGVEILASSEDRDNFVTNMVTIRAETRMALAIKRSSAIVAGTFPVTPVP